MLAQGSTILQLTLEDILDETKGYTEDQAVQEVDSLTFLINSGQLCGFPR